MIDIILKDDDFVASLNDMLGWLRSSDVPNRLSGNPSACDLTEEKLQRRKSGEDSNQCFMSRFEYHKDYDFSKIKELSTKLYEKETGRKDGICVPVAKTWYPPEKGYLGWHIDDPGGRIYISYSEGDSFFKWQNPYTKKITTSWDYPNAWSVRIFDFDEKNPMWHCVKAIDLRVSVGYKFVHAS